MSARIEFFAGFPRDLDEALERAGPDGSLGDHVPFHDVFDGVGEHEVAALFLAAGGPAEWRDPAAPGRVSRETIATLARLDDTRIGPLRRAWWERLGRRGEPEPELGQAVRGLVVQCRAAVANGWVVGWR